MFIQGARMAQSVEHATFDLGVVSSSHSCHKFDQRVYSNYVIYGECSFALRAEV